MPPFVPKSWGNFSTGGTPLNAAGLNDLEARISGAVAAQAVEDVHAYDYGVRGDGVTPSGVFLQNAVNAAYVNSARNVILPAAGGSNFMRIESAIEVPSGVKVIGQGIQGTSLKAIVGTFPTNTPMFRLGRSTDVDAFGTRLEDFNIDMGGIAGSTCVYSTCAEENSGLIHMSLGGWALYGMNFVGCQNFQCRDLWVTTGATGASAGIRLASCNTFTVEGGTVGNSNLTTGRGIEVTGCFTANIKQWNIEGGLIGIDVVGSHAALEGISGDSATGTLVRFNDGHKCSLKNSDSAGATTHLVDVDNGVSLSGAGFSLIGSYSQESYIGVTRILPGYASIPSTSGVQVGAIAFNTNPASAGFVGWVCVASGSPDVWKTFGLIS